MTIEERVDEIGDWRKREARDWAIQVMRAAINAAVEEDRKARPHSFVGRTDRGCEVCGEISRLAICISSLSGLRNRINLAVEEEREACAKICDRIADKEGDTPAAYDVPPRNCAIEIRARSTASSTSQEG